MFIRMVSPFTGKWDDEPLEIKYKDITLVEIDDRYTSIFSKYTEKR
jgi:hypothetical protein